MSRVDGTVVRYAAPSPAPITAARKVLAQLRTDIISGRLKPGIRLKLNDLAEQYDCGLIPLREALNRLAGENLISHSEQRGFSVAAVSLEDFADLTRARSMIAEIALRESIRHGDAAWEERILLSHHRLTKLDRYISLDPPVPNPAYDTLHSQFHSALLSGCGSAQILAISEDQFNHAARFRNISRVVEISPREVEHFEIMRASLARNELEAVQLLKTHIERTYEIVRRESRGQ